jgi:hypothetical protein
MLRMLPGLKIETRASRFRHGIGDLGPCNSVKDRKRNKDKVKREVRSLRSG